MIESITANRIVECDLPVFPCLRAWPTAFDMANTASQASNTHFALRRSTLVLDRSQTLSRRINVCSESWIMVTRIVPRPIAGITNELADIDGPTTKPSAPHTL
jgi:hypothetical protein